MFYLAKIVKSCQNAKLYSIDNVKIAGFVNCVLQQDTEYRIQFYLNEQFTFTIILYYIIYNII